MQESFLHFLWRWRRFDANELRSTEGQPIEVLHPGEWNHHAGPDFFNARVRIGDTTWAGNVELHVRASEWNAHRHSEDSAYDTVVLHVVLEEDQPIFRVTGERIPCLELQGRVPPKILENYQRLEQDRAWIPCQNFFQTTPAIVRLNWLDRMLVERLEQKTTAMAAALEATGNHWEEAFYRLLARSFGLKVNVEPFETLARSLPLSILARHRHDLKQVEALVFGQAGMLDADFEDKHPRSLAKEYQFLRHKYGLTPMDAGQWKFLRLRPANFPSIRLAQFAALMHRSVQLFSQILDVVTVRELEHLFEVHPDGYWLDHFQFDKPSSKRPKNLGRDFIHLIIINTIVPFLFYWGRSKKDESFEKRALELLEQLPAESNAILHEWAALDVAAKNALQSQALIHLKTHWCDEKRCLECSIGNAILK
jgi:hypothetical protein